MKHMHGAFANVCNADLDAAKIASAAESRPVVVAQVYGAPLLEVALHRKMQRKTCTWKQVCDHPLMRKLTWYVTTKKACSYVNL
jgi:hypothetical protein